MSACMPVCMSVHQHVAFGTDEESVILLAQVTILGRAPHANLVAEADLGDEGKAALGRHPVLRKASFLPLQLCDGQCLVDKCIEAAGGLDTRVVVSWFVQCARALAHLHSLGVYHLDVKPDNMLVGRDGVLRLSDYGCAVIDDEVHVGACSSRDRMSFFTHASVGTVMYAAPEVLRGHGPGVGGPWYDAAKADVWSLGISMLVCVTGSFVWEDAGAVPGDFWFDEWTAAWARVQCAHACELHVLLNRMGGKALASFPKRLTAVLAAMMDPEPGRRVDIVEALCGLSSCMDAL